jgi:hypothetical protein
VIRPLVGFSGPYEISDGGMKLSKVSADLRSRRGDARGLTNLEKRFIPAHAGNTSRLDRRYRAHKKLRFRPVYVPETLVALARFDFGTPALRHPGAGVQHRLQQSVAERQRQRP